MVTAQKLELPTFVDWDRGTVDPDGYTLYGWIRRRDGKRDFALIVFDDLGDPVYCASSSAKYSGQLTAWLIGAGADLVNNTCQLAPSIVEAIEKARASVRRCRVCGCTDARACDGGCTWAGADICSRCA